MEIKGVSFNVKQVIAIYDKEVVYSKRLAQYLGDVKKISFQIICFTKEETILNFMKSQSIYILIVNEQMLTERIQALSIPFKIIVTEESSHTRNSDVSEYQYVYKYQSADVIAQTIIGFLEKNKKQGEILWNQSVNVIGVYPFIIRDDLFSVTLAQVLSRELPKELSKKGNVFYCDLSAFSYVDTLFELEGEEKIDLSDAIYYKNQGNLKEQISNIIQTYGNVDYISPVRCPDDLRVITSEDIQLLLQEIVNIKGYKTIVLSLAECMYMPMELLLFCNRVYIPMENNVLSEKKKQLLFDYLERNGKGNIRDKFMFIHLPKYKEISAGVPYVEQLLWNDLGDFVRSLL